MEDQKEAGERAWEMVSAAGFQFAQGSGMDSTVQDIAMVLLSNRHD